MHIYKYEYMHTLPIYKVDMSTLITDPELAEHCSEILKAVAHPLRLKIVAVLCEKDLHVNALAELLEVGQAVVSQHLRILRMSDLVRVTRQRGFSMYSLAEPRLVDLVRCIERCGSL